MSDRHCHIPPEILRGFVSDRICQVTTSLGEGTKQILGGDEGITQTFTFFFPTGVGWQGGTPVAQRSGRTTTGTARRGTPPPASATRASAQGFSKKECTENPPQKNTAAGNGTIGTGGDGGQLVSGLIPNISFPPPASLYSPSMKSPEYARWRSRTGWASLRPSTPTRPRGVAAQWDRETRGWRC